MMSFGDSLLALCFLLMFQRRTQLSSRIVSNMIQTRDEVLITHDLPIAGNSNPLEVFIIIFIFIRPYKRKRKRLYIFSLIFLFFQRKTQCSRRLELQKKREDTCFYM